MAYCGPAGVAYSKFMQWDPLSRDLAIAWRQRENTRCGGCGVPYEDWYVDGEPDEDAYRPEKYVCPGCSKLASVETKNDAKGTLKRLVPNWWAARWRNYGRG